MVHLLCQLACLSWVCPSRRCPVIREPEKKKSSSLDLKKAISIYPDFLEKADFMGSTLGPSGQRTTGCVLSTRQSTLNFHLAANLLHHDSIGSLAALFQVYYIRIVSVCLLDSDLTIPSVHRRRQPAFPPYSLASSPPRLSIVTQ